MDRGPTPEEARLDGQRAQYIAAYKNALASRDAALNKARLTTGPGSEKWQSLQRKLTQANDTCRIVFAKLLRLSDGRRLPGWLLLIGALILAALEAPINKFMLDNILKGSNFDSYVFSLFVTLIILILAHIAGTQARQVRGAYQETMYTGNIVICAAILVILTIFVGALTIGRAFYSTTGPAIQGQQIFTEIGRAVQTMGVWTAFLSSLNDQAAFFLAAMNTAGIAGAFFIAMITHDSDKVYQAALDAAASTERKLGRMGKKYARAVDKVGEQFGPTLTNTAAAYGALNGQVVGLKRARNAPLVEDDRLDLSQFDQLLEGARAELKAQREAAGQPAPPKVFEDTIERASGVAQLVPKERK